jgi:hypothetical protein
MSLVSKKTDLKSLKFGRDRPNGGSSKEPYIVKKIPDELSSDIVRTGHEDFLLRGGALAPIKSVEDASRLTKMFTNPKGLLFTAKQNVLSRNSVETEATQGPAYRGKFFNQGIYLPTSTIAQAGVNFAGIHLNKMGIDPTGLSDTLSLKKYEDVVKENAKDENNTFTTEAKVIKGPPAPPQDNSILGSERFPPFIISESDTIILVKNANFNNRLLNIWYNRQGEESEKFLNVKEDSGGLRDYSGGPNSILGIGKTEIRFADQRTGKHNKYNSSNGDKKHFFGTNNKNRFDNEIAKDVKSKLEASKSASIDSTFIEKEDDRKILVNTSDPEFPNFITKEFKTSERNINELDTEHNKTGSLKDFNKEKQNDIDDDGKSSRIFSLKPSYKDKNISKRINMGDPGKSNTKNGKKDVFNYGIHANNEGVADEKKIEALDKVTALPLYSGNIDTSKTTNDLVKFRIATYSNESGGGEIYAHFRCFLTNFSDKFKADWKSTNYVGRGESFANYTGFSRDISIGFRVYAQSKPELIPMYKKLNYIASTLTPDYSESGFMRGNLSEITLGGYIYEQPGYITSIDFNLIDGATWEIAIDEKGNSDKSVKELPHGMDVSLSFTPIHRFLPQKAQGLVTPTEQYIALSDGRSNNNNYKDNYPSFNSKNNNTGEGTNL